MSIKIHDSFKNSWYLETPGYPSLSKDLWALIFSKLDMPTVLGLKVICKRFKWLIQNDVSLWKSLSSKQDFSLHETYGGIVSDGEFLFHIAKNDLPKMHCLQTVHMRPQYNSPYNDPEAYTVIEDAGLFAFYDKTMFNYADIKDAKTGKYCARSINTWMCKDGNWVFSSAFISKEWKGEMLFFCCAEKQLFASNDDGNVYIFDIDDKNKSLKSQSFLSPFFDLDSAENEQDKVVRTIVFEKGVLFFKCDMGIKIYEKEEGKWKDTGFCETPVIHFTVKNGKLYCAMADGEISIWKKNQNTWNEFKTVAAHTEDVTRIFWQDDFLVSASEDNKVKLWKETEVEDLKLEDSMQLSSHPWSTCYFSGVFFITPTNNFKKIEVFEKDGEEWVLDQQLIGHVNRVEKIIFYRSKLFSFSNNEMRVWGPAS